MKSDEVAVINTELQRIYSIQAGFMKSFKKQQTRLLSAYNNHVTEYMTGVNNANKNYGLNEGVIEKLEELQKTVDSLMTKVDNFKRESDEKEEELMQEIKYKEEFFAN